ncbi:Signal transduction histidine kinase [Ignavibacterium album JCM 16511]|uniref:histidine kinase n=1 Tax=Ignavibacterium album (strain DSM 19864 / JCM 16511 / NBRC 101810 / Mat9-16) TaxID=945713 RepID=I0AGA8_IGNAJ|nr:PAS domain S-box protein [Ignavibacterium album]AFH48015.1 Signal transduction histidine kinase [Ignavibacterium album JCM 16511]
MDEYLLKEDLQNIDLIFGQLWESSVDGMRLIDEEGKILLVNEAFCKMFGLTKEELIGKPFSIVYTKAEQEQALESFRKDIRNNKLKTLFERENTLWNNKKAWFEFSNSFLELPDGNKITLSIIKDITERKKSEINLRESEQKFKMLFNSAYDAVFVTQIQEGKTYGDFIEVNEIACKRLGYSKEEFLQLSPSAIVHPKSIDDYNRYSEILLREGHIIYEILHRAKDKKIIPVEINSHLFLYKEKLTILSIARDITERKIAEEKLKKNAKLLRELAAHLQSIREEERKTIAREIHDEFGQTLTVLKIKLTLLNKKIPEELLYLKNPLNEAIQMIDATVETVQKISSKLRPDILDELGLLPAIEWQVSEFEKISGIKCTVVLPAQEIPFDKERATAIFRILQEALTNIARHSAADKVQISLYTQSSKIVFEIKDNGKGITNEQIKDVKSLGIHGMEERVLIFGGSFSIEGYSGKGTTIKIEIPYGIS